jgi:tetratricopeptide (TPR) repeat protein
MLKKILVLSILTIFFRISVGAQCPDRDSLWKRLFFLRISSNIPPDEQLKELLGYEAALKKCSYSDDSNYALVLQRIGVIYSDQSDYLKALQYLKQSVKMNTPESGKASIRELVRSYYNLYLIYGELGRTGEKINVIDSCVGIALRTGLVDAYCLYPLIEKVEYLFDVETLQRAFSSAEMGESIVQKYSHGKDSMDYQ